MTRQEIDNIAADAANLRAALARQGFLPPESDALLTAAMPAIIACETAGFTSGFAHTD